MTFNTFNMTLFPRVITVDYGEKYTHFFQKYLLPEDRHGNKSNQLKSLHFDGVIMNLFFSVIIDLLLITSKKKKTSVSQSQSQYLFLKHRHESNSNLLNPNKAGLFEGSFFLGGWGWGGSV